MRLQPAARREGGALRDDRQPSHRNRAIAHHEEQRVARGLSEMHVAEISFRGEAGPAAQAEQGALLVVPTSGGTLVVAVAEPDVNVGLVRLELLRAAEVVG